MPIFSAEYEFFLEWAEKTFQEEVFKSLPPWKQVSGWRGMIIAVCDCGASYTPGPPIWNEGYPVWWHLTNVRMLTEPISCRGDVGMWQLPENIVKQLMD